MYEGVGATTVEIGGSENVDSRASEVPVKEHAHKNENDKGEPRKQLPKKFNVKWLQKEFEARGLKFTHEVLLPLATGLNQPGIRAFFVEGPPGTGKTALAETLASILDANLVFFQCTLNSGEDEFLYKLVPDEKTPSGIRKVLGPLPQAAISSQEKLTVLLVDEIDKARQSVDSLFLDFLQNGRISLYLDDKQTIIKAKPENLIVFMTTNNARELIEPLQRRLIRIVVKPLPAEVVFKLMMKQFNDKKLAALLAQIYQTTISAGLSKPATLQELRQLGHAIQSLGGLRKVNNNETLILLLKTYIIKNTDDEKIFFGQYRWPHYVDDKLFDKLIEEGQDEWEEEPEEEQEERKEKHEDWTEQLYDKKLKEEEKEERHEDRAEQSYDKKKEERKEETEQKKSLDHMITVKTPSEIIMPKITIKKDERIMAFAKIPASEYDKVIKAFTLSPQGSPDNLTKFSVVNDESENEMMIIANEPLDLMQFRAAEKARISGEYFVEDVITINQDVLYRYLVTNGKWKIKYWTKDKIVIEYAAEALDLQVKFTNLGDDKWKVEVYADGPYFSIVNRLILESTRQLVYRPKKLEFEENSNGRIAQVINMILNEYVRVKASIETLDIFRKSGTPYAKYLQDMLSSGIRFRLFPADHGIRATCDYDGCTVEVRRKVLEKIGRPGGVFIDIENMDDLDRVIKILNDLMEAA